MRTRPQRSSKLQGLFWEHKLVHSFSNLVCQFRRFNLNYGCSESCVERVSTTLFYHGFNLKHEAIIPFQQAELPRQQIMELKATNDVFSDAEKHSFVTKQGLIKTAVLNTKTDDRDGGAR